jgi:hypothetical protein
MLSPLFPIFGDELNPGVMAPNSKPFERPYAEWVAKWWQWWLGMPSGRHILDTLENGTRLVSPEQCATMQEGPVWFLPDYPVTSEVTAECNIPLGKAILFPLSHSQCDYAYLEFSGKPQNDEELRNCVSTTREWTTMSVSIDGRKMINPNAYTTLTDVFNIEVPSRPVTFYEGLSPGVTKSMVKGEFVLLEPLPKGDHKIEYEVKEKFTGIDTITQRKMDYILHVAG